MSGYRKSRRCVLARLCLRERPDRCPRTPVIPQSWWSTSRQDAFFSRGVAPCPLHSVVQPSVVRVRMVEKPIAYRSAASNKGINLTNGTPCQPNRFWSV